MAILSRKTCALAIELLSTRTATELDLLFYKCEVPKNIIVGTSKKATVLNVFQHLEAFDPDLRLKIIEAAVNELPPDYSIKLKKALARDGFTVEGDAIIPDEPIAQEHKTALEALVFKHTSKVEATTLLHHLKEAEEHYKNGKWDSSIGQARNFVEQLLKDIATRIAQTKSETPLLDKPLKVRDYLQNTGFFDTDERKKLVDGVYGYLSGEGSHPGISNQSTARVCLSVLWNFGYYVIEKFDELGI